MEDQKKRCERERTSRGVEARGERVRTNRGVSRGGARACVSRRPARSFVCVGSSQGMAWPNANNSILPQELKGRLLSLQQAISYALNCPCPM